MAKLLPVAVLITLFASPAWSQVPNPCPPAAAPAASTTGTSAPGSDGTEPPERQPIERSAILPDGRVELEIGGAALSGAGQVPRRGLLRDPVVQGAEVGPHRRWLEGDAQRFAMQAMFVEIHQHQPAREKAVEEEPQPSDEEKFLSRSNNTSSFASGPSIATLRTPNRCRDRRGRGSGTSPRHGPQDP
jgi:hypothetical protein